SSLVRIISEASQPAKAPIATHTIILTNILWNLLYWCFFNFARATFQCILRFVVHVFELRANLFCLISDVLGFFAGFRFGFMKTFFNILARFRAGLWCK